MARARLVLVVNAETVALAPDQWAFLVVSVLVMVFLLGFQVGKGL